VRGSYQHVMGNRFAFPETSNEVKAALATGVLDDSTDMVLVGAQFSF